MLDRIRRQYQSRSNDFFRQYYDAAIYFLMATIGVVVLMVGIILYQLIHQPLPSFFAAQPNGEKRRLTPFTEPNLLPSTLIAWATKAATLAYAIDYVSYPSQLQRVRPYFTKDGWQDYSASVDGLIKSIIQNQLIVNGVVIGQPVISNEGPLPNLGYTWRLQIPFLVTYQSANTSVQRRYYVILTIVRVPTSINPQGIGIDQFVVV